MLLHKLILAKLEDFLWVFFSSMFKFVAGPVFGALNGMTFLETLITTVLGMMTTVLIITYFGKYIRQLWINIFGAEKQNKKVFTKRNRRFIHIWRTYGEFGISFLTPVIFSPVIGTLVITTLGGRRNKIISYMLISATFWGATLFFIGESILNVIKN